ncbi:MAG: autotransporter [Burkholderiaceae bacterium]|nr:autotransporter [Burkholderiaceae bacterium]
MKTQKNNCQTTQLSHKKIAYNTLKKFILVTVLSNICFYASAQAQTTDSIDEITKQRDAWFLYLKNNIVGSHPKPGSALEELDRQGSAAYQILGLNNATRLELANDEANQKERYVFSLFNTSVFGKLYSNTESSIYDNSDYKSLFAMYYKNTPYAQDSLNPDKKGSTRASDFILKDYYHRGRPYQVLDDNYNYIPDYETISGSSYPSGHTMNGFKQAVVYAMIFPERGDEIFSRALENGESRVILGAHFPTDTILSRVLNYYYMSQYLNNPVVLQSTIDHAKQVRLAAANMVDCPDLKACLLQQETPITDGYAKQNNAIGYYGIFTDKTPPSYITASQLPSKSENLLLLRFPYLSADARRTILATTSYPKNSLANMGLSPTLQDSGLADKYWGLIDLPKAYNGPTQLDDILVVDQTPGLPNDLADFGTKDIWKNSISGVGGIFKKGSGELTLAGNNTYTGDTTVNQGVLKAGLINAFSEKSGVRIDKDGTLDLNGYHQKIASLAGEGKVLLGSGSLDAGSNDTNTTFAGEISGSGGLIKTGAGTMSLMGKNAYSGQTTIDNGVLELSKGASLDNSTISTQSTSTVGTSAKSRTGAATFGTLKAVDNTRTGSVTNAGKVVVSAGKTLSINGDYTSSGVTEIAVNGMSDYGKINATGQLNLGGDLYVDVSQGAQLTNGSLESVLKGNSIVGAFKSSLTNSLLFKFSPHINNNQVDLDVKAATNQPSSPSTPSPTPNQPNPVPPITNKPDPSTLLGSSILYGKTLAYGAAEALDKTFKNNAKTPLASYFWSITNSEQAANAAVQTTPLLTRQTSEVMLNTTQLFQGAIQNHLTASPAAHHCNGSASNVFNSNSNADCSWIQPLGTWSNQQNKGGIAGYDGTTLGVIGGVDKQIDAATRVGFSASYARNNLTGNEQSNTRHTATVNMYQLFAYGKYGLNDSSALGGYIGSGYHHVDGTRPIPFAGLSAHSSYGGIPVMSGIGYSYYWRPTNNLTITPQVRVDYSRQHEQGYTESGADALNLKVQGQTAQSLLIGAGSKIEYQSTPSAKLYLQFMLGYDALARKRNKIDSSFASTPDSNFVTNGMPRARASISTGLGLSYQPNDQTNLSLSYNLEKSSKYLNQGVGVSLRRLF